MKTLWDKLKPEYKKTIEWYIEDGKYTSGPQTTKKVLKEHAFFGELSVDNLKNLFIWTDNDIINVEWQDLWGERFLIEEKNK
tara:strand:+ start:121 stop:366 length:246 start_codon:yes stop_codon:yes gene_type:complete